MRSAASRALFPICNVYHTILCILQYLHLPTPAPSYCPSCHHFPHTFTRSTMQLHPVVIFGLNAQPLFARRAPNVGYQLLPFSFSLKGLQDSVDMGASTISLRPRVHSTVFVQGLAPKTPAQSSSATQSPAKSSAPPSSPTPSIDGGRPSEQPKPKKSGVVKRMLLDFGAVPFPALALGVAGLIPFVALAPPLSQMLPLPDLLHAAPINAQAAYGACIISFLGALHWGLAMADYAAPDKGGVANMTLMTTRYVWSVVPSLMAWTALVLPPASKFALLIFSLWMVLGVDFLFARLRLVPYWFLALRWPLTFVATVSMVPSLLTAAAWAY